MSFQVDVNVDHVMPNGEGLVHSSFCVLEIAKSKLNCNLNQLFHSVTEIIISITAIYSCGFKTLHGNKEGLVKYDRHLINSNGFGSQNSLDLNSGFFIAPVEGVYLVNFESHFDTLKTESSEYRIVIR